MNRDVEVWRAWHVIHNTCVIFDLFMDENNDSKGLITSKTNSLRTSFTFIICVVHWQLMAVVVLVYFTFPFLISNLSLLTFPCPFFAPQPQFRIATYTRRGGAVQECSF